MRIEEPYHPGELLVQERAGELARGERNGRVINKTIVAGAIPFLAKQTTMVLGSLDERGRVWASLVFGPPGFIRAPDPQTVEFDLARVQPPDDPVWAHLARDPRVGLLAIDLASRRRLRVNGRVTTLAPDEARVEVHEAYPNCPKYIQRRHLQADWSKRPRTRPQVRMGTSLGPEMRKLLQQTDTFFVASAHPDRGVDASHRGGNPGFVQVLDDATLRIPDYAGNSLFNTLGNFAVYPHAGLVVPDFEGGRLLQIVGRPEIRWGLDDPRGQTGGTRRYWDLHVEEWVCADMPAGLEWELLDRSPHNPQPDSSEAR